MSEFLSAMSDLFTFLITQVGNIANFFTTTTLGMIILGITLFTIVFKFICFVIDKVQR